MKREDVGFFDPKIDWGVVERALPHWSQPGTLTFITWRLADSLPKSVLDRLDQEITTLLRKEGFDSTSDWKQQLSNVHSTKRAELQSKLFATRDKYLDQGHGKCLLADIEIADLVLESLKKFDGERYFLTDAVIMPNHVHFLCAFVDDGAMLKQCKDWKRYTARQINRRLERKGELWQVDQFDHLVRNEEAFLHFRRYIATNPVNAALKPGAYRHFQKAL